MKYVPPVKKSFPINLIVEGKQCLVVGGGKAAAKKITNLLGSGASVTVVSPSLGEQTRRMHEEGAFQWIDRPFEPSDLEDRLLVYCATPDPRLNKSILQQCQEKKILCCPVDKNWPEGDFMTPATFRKDELSISISSGGTSCRRSRLVKQSLSRHVDMIDSADLLLIGTSHSFLPLEKREPFHLDGDKLEQTGRMLRSVWGIHEFLILNTCNRIEVMAVIADDESVHALIQRILGFDTLEEGEFYIRRGWEAFAHSCTLLAGLFSQTPGENHIVAQVKDAFKTAEGRGWTGVLLEDWTSRALGVSKTVRLQTGPLLKNLEIEDVTVEYLHRSLEEYQGLRKAMVVGTGVIGRGVLAKLLEQEIPVIWGYHQDVPELSDAMAGRVELCSLPDLYKRIEECDCIITATGSPVYLLDESHSGFFPREKKMFLADLSLPRNISPRLHQPDHSISVADLDDLKHWFRREAADMEAILDINRTIIEENRDHYERISASFQSGNTQQ